MNDITQIELEDLTDSDIAIVKRLLFAMIFACFLLAACSFSSAVLMLNLIKDEVEIVLLPISILVINVWFCVWLLLWAWFYIDVYKVVKKHEKSRKLRKISG